MPEEIDYKNWEATESMGKDVKDTKVLQGWATAMTPSQKETNETKQNNQASPVKKNLGGNNKL